MSFLKSKKTFSIRPPTDSSLCHLIGQNRVTCPFLNPSLGIELRSEPALTEINKDAPPPPRGGLHLFKWHHSKGSSEQEGGSFNKVEWGDGC